MPLFDIRSITLPYKLQLQPCGNYVICNREHKPVGFSKQELYNYEDFPVLVPIRVTPALASRLSHNQSTDTVSIYLYSDGCIPTTGNKEWESYQKRLCLLAKQPIAIDFDHTVSSRVKRVCKANLRDARKPQPN